MVGVTDAGMTELALGPMLYGSVVVQLWVNPLCRPRRSDTILAVLGSFASGHQRGDERCH